MIVVFVPFQFSPTILMKGYAVSMELPNEMSRSLELSTQNTHDESNTSSGIEVHVFVNPQKFVNVYSMLQYGNSKNRVKAEV